jgi:hypothetical protein
MQVIKNNPFRTIGLLAGTGVREERAKVKKLKMLIEAEQEAPEDFSFPVLGQLDRNIDTVAQANLMLDLDIDRVNAAIFWFYDGGTADEPAFDYLKEGEIDKAIAECWNKTFTPSGITKGNCSAFHNLSTLKLNIAFNGSEIDTELLEEGIELKLKFLDSDFFHELVRISTDETFKTTKEDLQKYFLDRLQSEIENDTDFPVSRYFEIINNHSFSAKQDFINKFIQKPIEKVEKQIEAADAKRKSSPKNSCKTGLGLYQETKADMELLALALGESWIKFSSLSDKVSEELLLCALDFFELHRESDTPKPGTSTLRLLELARELAIGEFIQLRCDEKITEITEWVEEIRSTGKIRPQIKYLAEQVVEFKPPEDTNITSASYSVYVLRFVRNCQPKLSEIKAIIGTSEPIYQNASQAVAFQATNNIIKILNLIIENQATSVSLYSNAEPGKRVIDVLIDAMNIISTLDMEQETRTWFDNTRVSVNKWKYPPQAATKPGKSDGCYIATMVYGHYDHPQVLMLRSFRDRRLARSRAGRTFIRLYYRWSPLLVEKLKNKRTINNYIRMILNASIKFIKR